jgi:hypothetical protein
LGSRLSEVEAENEPKNYRPFGYVVTEPAEVLRELDT